MNDKTPKSLTNASFTLQTQNNTNPTFSSPKPFDTQTREPNLTRNRIINPYKRQTTFQHPKRMQALHQERNHNKTNNQSPQIKVPHLKLEEDIQELNENNNFYDTDQTRMTDYYQKTDQAMHQKKKKRKLSAEDLKERQRQLASCCEQFLKQMECTPTIHKWLHIREKPNERWGSVSPYKKPDGVFRFGHQNVNGIPFSRDGLNFGLAFYKVEQVCCDAFSFVETNLEWMLPDVTSCIKMVAQIMMGNVKTTQSTSSQKFDKPWKPGGTLLCLYGRYAGCVIGHHSNSLGRWSQLRVGGKSDTTISSFSAYRVPQMLNPGPSSSYAQQQTIMFATRGPKFRPRDAVINDFIVQILSAQAMGDHILIGIDANKEMGTDRIGIVKLMQECELIDLLTCFPSESPPPDMYNQENTRIDYILGSAHVAECVLGGCTVPYGECCPSNHRMICVNFNTAELFGNPPSIPPPPLRHFNTKQPKPTMKYKEELNRLFHDRGVWTRLDRIEALLQDASQAQTKLDSLESEITRCMKKAAQLYAKKRDLWRPWTPQEWVQGLECMYWRLLETQHKMGRNHFEQLLSLKITLLENKILVPDRCLCSTEIKKM